jgi:carbonic anhydrase
MTNLKTDFLPANEKYAETFKDGDLLASPSKKIAVLSCMDAIPNSIIKQTIIFDGSVNSYVNM